MVYRPWGELEWSLTLSDTRKWYYLGVLGTEERSLAAAQTLSGRKLCKEHLFLEIHDSQSLYTQEANALLALRKQELGSMKLKPIATRRCNLLDATYQIDEIAEIVTAQSAVMLDITAMPKRFFFRLLRALYKSERVEDLVLIYATPLTYAKTLSLGSGVWHYLPGFEGEPESEPKRRETLIVGAGFMVESLQQTLSDMTEHEKIKILIPFPASSIEAIRRSWETVLQMYQGRDDEKFEHYRVDAHDISAAFDRISTIARSSRENIAFGPFGPKPMSAAMCLYASQCGAIVYYPQPHAYDPAYSKGVKKCWGYWIKHSGAGLYSVVK